MPKANNPPDDEDDDILEGFGEEDQKEIRKAAAARHLAYRRMERERSAAAESGKPCSRCGKPKNEGEHGEGKCKKKGLL